MIAYSPLDYTASVAVALSWVVILCGLAVILGLIADRPWRHRHVRREDELPTLLDSPRAEPRRAGEGRAARPGQPGGAPDTVAITAPTARPYAAGLSNPDLDTLPVLIVDSPPSMRGTLPTPDLGTPIVRRHCCSYCRDGADVIGNSCAWCGEPHPMAVRA